MWIVSFWERGNGILDECSTINHGARSVCVDSAN